MLVMIAMVSAPAERRVLKRCRSEYKSGQLYRPFGFEREMRKQTVISERDAQAGCDKEGEEKSNLKPVKTVGPNVGWDGCDAEQCRARQKDAIRQSDGFRFCLGHDVGFLCVFLNLF